MRAGSNAIPTRQAAFGREHHRRGMLLAFGIVAPDTAKWTAFQKNRGPNSRPVIHGESHEVEDHAFGNRLIGLEGGPHSSAALPVSGPSLLVEFIYARGAPSKLCLGESVALRRLCLERARLKPCLKESQLSLSCHSERSGESLSRAQIWSEKRPPSNGHTLFPTTYATFRCT